MIRDYFRLVFFAASLLVGVQIPNIIDQYEKRVDAHLTEATENLTGFQETANEFFSGNLETLIKHYQQSQDPVIRRDAESLDQIYQRTRNFQAEQAALQQSWYRVIIHLVFNRNEALFAETLRAYTYNVPLNQQAITWGVATGFTLTLICELVLMLLFQLLAPRSRPKNTASKKSFSLFR
ncbi:MAG: DUF2937 family protein [Gammaproteobacteria bacterium]|nr:DUF2937 family protein [Gammaproteobacteria bacterium]